MKHFFSTKVKVIIVLAILLTVGLTLVSSLTGENIPSKIVQGILTPIRSGAKALTNQAEQYYSYMFHYESLAAENAALKEELAALKDDIRESSSLARENDRLRALLDLKAAHEDYELVDAYVIGKSSGDWTSTFQINRGTSSGIEAGMCAITANGEVVGLVTEAGSNYAVVKSVLDSSLEISATMSSSGYGGVVQGGYTSGYEDLLRMDYIPSSAVIRNNDQVVTAGSTVYPRNLILGRVVDAGYEDTGVAKFAILEPAADIGNLEQVFIITAYNAE
ncbi:MAG: rod shape-determining protein MreC [Oscillospiraceae bacterium]|nr:rod shape-determining protein MreC [Oscillospiraceae bacterium]